jgi:hypothetical protein
MENKSTCNSEVNVILENMLKQLKDYSIELDITHPLSLFDLINSHRTIRKNFLQSKIETQEQIQKGIIEGIRTQLCYNYVNTNTFFDLPLREIINRYFNE